MPRKARIDAPGALHHIIARGIARKKVFDDNADRDFFVDRLGLILSDGKTQCFAWALIPNHFSPAIKNRGDTDFHGNETAFNRLCDALQSAAQALRTSVSKSIQVHPVPRGYIPSGTGALYPLEPCSCKAG